MVKKTVSLLLIVAVFLTMFPGAALAEGEPGGTLFNLSYNANGGEGTLPPLVTQPENSTAAVSDGSGLKYGELIFRKWNTQIDGLGKDYFAGDEYMFIADTTLYAVYSEPVHVTGVTLDSKVQRLLIGSTYTLTATVLPEDASYPGVTWTSNSKTVASVDQNGLVTALETGSTMISATAGGMSDSCDVTVVDEQFTVTFNTQGGGEIANVMALDGGTIEEPDDPVREGYTFDGWYKEQQCISPWNFYTDTVSSDITLYAEWTQAGCAFSGSGTKENPYRITNAGELADLASFVNEGNALYIDKCYIQTQDIDLSAYENWAPIGTYSSKPFSGTYEGNGNNISGLKINLTQTQTQLAAFGLFGYITGSVNNIAVINSNIEISTNDNIYTGSIVGYIKNGIIQNCKVFNTNIVTSSKSTGNVGGIVGCANNSSILDSAFSGNINGIGKLIKTGGISGSATGETSIIACKNEASVYAENTDSGGYAGGILGCTSGANSYCTIEECFNSGGIFSKGSATSTLTSAGGISGYGYKLNIYNCYNVGRITSESQSNIDYAGGIIGYRYQNGNIYNSYNIGYLAGLYCGGIAGNNTTTTDFISNCYYADTCKSAVGSGTGTAFRKTLEELRQQSTYARFDFDTVWTLDKAVETGYNYPQLKDNLLYTRKHELSLTANNEQGYAEGAGTYNFFETITISAHAQEHYVFKNWAVTSGGAILADSGNPTAAVIMPNTDVSIEAVFDKQKYTLTVESEGSGTVSGSGSYTWGDETPISAAAGSGFQFMRWEIVSGQAEISDFNNMSATITMSQTDVTIRAVFGVQPVGFTYTVNDGKATITGYSGTNEIVTIPDRLGGYWVRAVGVLAFHDKKSITRIIIPDSVETIAGSAFSDCTSLVSVSIGKNVNNIDSRAFLNCISLTDITVSEENSCYKSSEGVVYNKTGTELIRCCPGKPDAFSIPEEVKTIHAAAFDHCIHLSEMHIPDTVIAIEEFAFSCCTNLSDITVPDSVTSIGDSAFIDCTKLQNVSLSGNISAISYRMFTRCRALKSIAIPDSVISIGNSAFEDCSTLENVTFSENLKSIGDTAFYKCNLKTLCLPVSLATLGENAFSNSPALYEAYFSGAIPEFGLNVFSSAASTFKVYYHVSKSVGWSLFSSYPKQAFCFTTMKFQNGQVDKTVIVLLDDRRLPQLPAPTWSDHTFEGWHKEEACTNAWDFDKDKAADDIVLFAKWRPGPYTVAASSNDSSCGCVTGGGVYNDEDTVVLHAEPFEGCRFVAWLKDGETISGYSDYTFTANGSCSYIAEFVEIEVPEIISSAYIGDSSIGLVWSQVQGAAGYRVWRSEDVEGPYIDVDDTLSASYIDRGLAMGTTYFYMIDAYCVNGTTTTYSEQSEYISQKAELPAPINVSADSLGYESINIAWNGVQGADEYEIFRSTTKSGSYSFVYSTPATNYTNRKLKTGTTYYYKVRAHEAGTYSEFSDIVFSVPVPAQAAGLNLKICSVTKIKLSWKGVSGRNGYEVWRSTLPDSGYEQIKTTRGKYCYDTAVKPNTPYYYKVRAYRNEGKKRIPGVFSEVKTASTVLINVTGAAAAAYYPTSIKVSWKAVPGRRGYEVERSLYPDDGFKAIKSTKSTYYKDTRLITNTRYYYRIRAYVIVNGKREYSGYSEIVSAVPVLKNVTGVKTKVYSPVKVKISWKSVSGSKGYEISRSLASDGEYEVIRSTTKKYYYDSGLEPNKTYYYKIRAYRTISGERKLGGESGAVSASPTLASAAGAAAYAYSSTANKVTWKPVSGRSGYEIYRSEIPESGFTYIGSTTRIYYYDKNSISGKTYYYQVRAYVFIGKVRFYTDYSNTASVIRA